jgi:drug/metabolite transporter (DMT)-like permease
MPRALLLGIALTIVSAFGFGSGALFAKPVYAAGVDWLTLMTWRFTIGAALSLGFVVATGRRRAALRAMDRRSVLVAGALGVLYTGNASTYFAGLETVPVSLAALIVYVYPAIVAVLSIRLGRRLEGRRAWGALGLALAGVALAVGNIETATAPPVGGLLLIAASPVIYSFWIVLSARLAGERRSGVGHGAEAGSDPLALGAVMMSATALAYWIGSLATGRPVLPSQIPAAAWSGIAGIGLVATFIAIQAFYAGAHRMGAARASLVSTVEPVWTIVLAGILFHETLSPIQLVGGAMILAGVVLAQTGPSGAAVSATELRIADE